MNKISILSLFTALVFLAACNPDDTQEELQNVRDTYQDENEVAKLFDNSAKNTENEMDAADSKIAEGGGRADSVTNDTSSFCPCATRTINRKDSTLTIFYGEDGCLCRDGRTRYGTVIIRYQNGRYRDAGSIMTTTLENFRVKNGLTSEIIQIRGVHSLTNVTTDPNQPTWEIDVRGEDGAEFASATFANGEVVQWKSTRQRTLIEGADTRWSFQNRANPETFLGDDVYTITGTSNGVSRTGQAWEASSTDADPIVYKLECWYKSGSELTFSPVGGQFTLQPADNDEPTIVNYGDGKCDREAVVTFNGRDFTFTLNR